MTSSCDLYLISFLILTFFARIVYSAPNVFCLDRFDDGDCGQSPVAVAYYYKPGSRCEIRYWRGCSTLNMFPDYFSCFHFCVMKIWGNNDAAINGFVMPEPEYDEDDWIEELQTLEVNEIKAIDQILTEVVEMPLEKMRLTLKKPVKDVPADDKENEIVANKIDDNDDADIDDNDSVNSDVNDDNGAEVGEDKNVVSESSDGNKIKTSDLETGEVDEVITT